MSSSLDPQSYGELAGRIRDDPSDGVWMEYRTCFERALAAARRRLHEPLTPEEHEINVALAQSSQWCVEVLDEVHRKLRSG
jgi:hypothetical protein